MSDLSPLWYPNPIDPTPNISPSMDSSYFEPMQPTSWDSIIGFYPQPTMSGMEYLHDLDTATSPEGDQFGAFCTDISARPPDPDGQWPISPLSSMPPSSSTYFGSPSSGYSDPGTIPSTPSTPSSSSTSKGQLSLNIGDISNQLRDRPDLLDALIPLWAIIAEGEAPSADLARPFFPRKGSHFWACVFPSCKLHKGWSREDRAKKHFFSSHLHIEQFKCEHSSWYVQRLFLYFLKLILS